MFFFAFLGMQLVQWTHQLVKFSLNTVILFYVIVDDRNLIKKFYSLSYDFHFMNSLVVILKFEQEVE